MQPDKLTRRRLLGSVVTALTAWLCPRPSRAAVAPHQPTPPAASQPNEHGLVTSYSYDNMGQRRTSYAYDDMGRLVRVTEHPHSAYVPYKSRNTFNHSAEG